MPKLPFGNSGDLKRLKYLFDSIVCLCAEGPEFHSKLELVEYIQKEAVKGYNLCKEMEND